MLRQLSTRRIIVFFLIDSIGTLLVLNAAGLFHDGLLHRAPWGTVWPGQPSGWADSGTFISPRGSLPLVVILMVALVWPVLFSAFSIYDGRRNESLRVELTNVLLAICLCTMTLAGLLYFTYRDIPHTLIALFFALDLTLLCGGRITLWVYRRWENGSRPLHHLVIVVSTNISQAPTVRRFNASNDRCFFNQKDRVCMNQELLTHDS
jgi:hypothetical protein